MAMEKLDDLDKEQKEAVMSAPENPLVIFAGAGSGKTTTLIRRMSFAMVMGEDPSGVLCLTFSRSAAEDLRARVGSHCGAANARAATICTFHGFCLRLLRRHLASMPQYGYREGFHICARQEQREVIEQCLGLWLETDSGKLDAELVRPGAMARVISSTAREIERRKMGPPDAVGEPRLEFVIGHYRAALVFANAVDYSGYPDCRPEYIAAFEQLANLATKAGVEGDGIRIHAPLLKMTKAEIIHEGIRLGVDYGLTSSCYDPADDGQPCGVCESCVLRAAGFANARLADPLCDQSLKC